MTASFPGCLKHVLANKQRPFITSAAYCTLDCDKAGATVENVNVPVPRRRSPSPWWLKASGTNSSHNEDLWEARDPGAGIFANFYRLRCLHPAKRWRVTMTDSLIKTERKFCLIYFVRMQWHSYPCVRFHIVQYYVLISLKSVYTLLTAKNKEFAFFITGLINHIIRLFHTFVINM